MTPFDETVTNFDVVDKGHLSCIHNKNAILDQPLDEKGIRGVVDQQFSYERIIKRGLCPIIEPEVNIMAQQNVRLRFLLRCLVQKLDDMGGEVGMLNRTPRDRQSVFPMLNIHVLKVVASLVVTRQQKRSSGCQSKTRLRRVSRAD